jgi:hypothetical protein
MYFRVPSGGGTHLLLGKGAPFDHGRRDRAREQNPARPGSLVVKIQRLVPVPGPLSAVSDEWTPDHPAACRMAPVRRIADLPGLASERGGSTPCGHSGRAAHEVYEILRLGVGNACLK